MALIRALSGSSGGGSVTDYVFAFTAGELSNVTSSNPVVINGDFSNIKTIAIIGTYVPDTSSSNSIEANYENNIVLGNTYRIRTGKSGSSQWIGYRDITVTATQVTIGNGYYGTSSSSATSATNYGGINFLILSPMSVWK